MTCYVVLFQIADATSQEKLCAHLKTYGTFCPINTSAWAIVTEKKAADIRDALNEFSGKSDRVFVIKTGGEAAWRNAISPDHSEWLKKYL